MKTYYKSTALTTYIIDEIEYLTELDRYLRRSPQFLRFEILNRAINGDTLQLTKDRDMFFYWKDDAK